MISDDKIILNVGLACLDSVVTVAKFPEEDSDQRCISHVMQSGGNACNNCMVMAELDIPCEYFGVLTTDLGGRFVKENLVKAGIHCDNCVLVDDKCPTAFVMSNLSNGSRTILSLHKGLPELSFSDFEKLELKKYKWVHFEARRGNVEELKKMLELINDFNNKQDKQNYLPVSVELEKTLPEFLNLIDMADVIIASKDFAKMLGFNDMQIAAIEISKSLKQGGTVICPWAEKGACAKQKDGPIYCQESFPPEKIVDTLAAGDTFVAATVVALSKKESIEVAIRIGCQVAGVKCGMQRLKGLKNAVKNAYSLVL